MLGAQPTFPPVEEIKPEEVKPKENAKARAKAKAKVKEELKEEVRVTEDDATRRAQLCLSSSKEEEITPKNRNRPELKEKANCLDCGKELTVHGLKYTHKRFCKANQPEQPGLRKTSTNAKVRATGPTR